MIGLLAAMAVVFAGIMLNSGLLIGFGFIGLAVQLMLDYLQPKPVAVPQAAAMPARHRIIQATDDAWKMPEDDIWVAMMGSGPMGIGGGQMDPLKLATSGLQNPHSKGVTRGMLPFRNYGYDSGPMGAVEHMFWGLPFNIGNFIRK